MHEQLVATLIYKESYSYWLNFLKGLELNLNGPLGFSACLKAVAIPEEGAQIYSILLRGVAPYYRTLSAVIQFNRPFTKSIHIHPVSPEGISNWILPLAPLPNEKSIGGVWKECVIPLEALSLADIISDEMINCIDPLG